MFCTGAIVQTFFLQIGLNEQQVYLYNSLIQAAQVVMMVLMIFISPRIKKVKLVTGLSYLSLTAIAVILFVAAVAPSAVNELYIIIIFAISVLCNLGVGIYMVLAYCIPYYTIDMSNYGRFISLQMVFTGAGTFAFSSLHTFVISKFDYLPSMACFFAFSILLFMMASFFCLSMKEKKDVEVSRSSSKEDYVAVFKNKDTYVLLIPNFARGIAVGVVNVITVIAISSALLDEQTSAYINIVMQVAMFAGNLLYAAFCKKIPTRRVLLIATVGASLFLPICLNFGTLGFLLIFFFAYFFRMIMDTALPVIVTEIIPREQIGAYTSIRMLLFTGAQAVAALLVTPIVNAIGYAGLLIFASAMQIVCGGVYCLVAKKRKREMVRTDDALCAKK
jgi:MFS family permease